MSLGDMFKNFGQMASLMKNEDFKVLMANPKFQSLMKDPGFVEDLKSKNYLKLMSHPGLQGLMQDPETRELFLKLNPKDFGL